MKVFAIALAGVLSAGAVVAGPLDDAGAGRDALAHGDPQGAIHFLSQALDSGGLAPDVREWALTKRAEAYLAIDEAAKAVADANEALSLNPTDSTAVDVRGRAQASIAGQGSSAVGGGDATTARLNSQVKSFNAGVATRNQTAETGYEARVAEYEARKKAAADAYAAQQASYQTQVQAEESQRAADVAAWRARVTACKAGDTSKCSQPAPR